MEFNTTGKVAIHMHQKHYPLKQFVSIDAIKEASYSNKESEKSE